MFLKLSSTSRTFSHWGWIGVPGNCEVHTKRLMELILH